MLRAVRPRLEGARRPGWEGEDGPFRAAASDARASITGQGLGDNAGA